MIILERRVLRSRIKILSSRICFKKDFSEENLILHWSCIEAPRSFHMSLKNGENLKNTFFEKGPLPLM